MGVHICRVDSTILFRKLGETVPECEGMVNICAKALICNLSLKKGSNEAIFIQDIEHERLTLITEITSNNASTGSGDSNA